MSEGNVSMERRRMLYPVPVHTYLIASYLAHSSCYVHLNSVAAQLLVSTYYILINFTM